MIEALRFLAEVMFWALVDIGLAVVWAVLIAKTILKLMGKNDD